MAATGDLPFFTDVGWIPTKTLQPKWANKIPKLQYVLHQVTYYAPSCMRDNYFEHKATLCEKNTVEK